MFSTRQVKRQSEQDFVERKQKQNKTKGEGALESCGLGVGVWIILCFPPEKFINKQARVKHLKPRHLVVLLVQVGAQTREKKNKVKLLLINLLDQFEVHQVGCHCTPSYSVLEDWEGMWGLFLCGVFPALGQVSDTPLGDVSSAPPSS